VPQRLERHAALRDAERISPADLRARRLPICRHRNDRGWLLPHDPRVVRPDRERRRDLAAGTSANRRPSRGAACGRARCHRRLDGYHERVDGHERLAWYDAKAGIAAVLESDAVPFDELLRIARSTRPQ
jgi:hypothetical protein